MRAKKLEWEVRKSCGLRTGEAHLLLNRIVLVCHEWEHLEGIVSAYFYATPDQRASLYSVGAESFEEAQEAGQIWCDEFVAEMVEPVESESHEECEHCASMDEAWERMNDRRYR